jgi:hypothetical protein
MVLFQGIRRSYISISSGDPVLDNLIEEEKDTVHSMTNLAKEVGDGSHYVLKWGNEEHFDLKDIATHFSQFEKDIESFLFDLAESYTDYRRKLKEITKMSDVIRDLQKKHSAVTEKLKKHKKSGKRDLELERDEEELDMHLLTETSEFEYQKRKLFQEGMMIKFKGWELFSARMTKLSYFVLIF